MFIEFYDRYIIIDWNTEYQRIYHCGASSKDAGQRITSITEVVDQMIYTDLINKLLKNQALFCFPPVAQSIRIECKGMISRVEVTIICIQQISKNQMLRKEMV